MLIVGSGVAGLMAALTTAPNTHTVLVTKGALTDGCSVWAQGGIAAAMGADDSPELHKADTVAAGRGLCDPRAVDVLVDEGPRQIAQLATWIPFDKQGDTLALGQEAAHTRARIVHAGGDATGRVLETGLADRLRSMGVQVYEGHTVLELLLDDEGRCRGAELGNQRMSTLHRIVARATILASGGASGLWRHTTNPVTATGEGIGLAYHAGADVASMEFEQFHPTVLALNGAPRFLISEAVRGDGAHVVNEAGERFLFDSDARGELAPRDVVANAIWRELRKSSTTCVYLDCRPVATPAQRFPSIFATCQRYGIDMTRDRIPISPAAHYSIGGVRTDIDGATSVDGLFACGEVANTGVHGANRLASNSLTEAIVFGRRAGDAALQRVKTLSPTADRVAAPQDSARPSRTLEMDVANMQGQLADALWRGAGIERDARGLAMASEVADSVYEGCAGDVSLSAQALKLSATTAQLVCSAANARRESRGVHIRSDFPDTSAQWLGVWTINKHKGAYLDSYA